MKSITKTAGAGFSLIDSAGSAASNFLVGLSAVRTLPDAGIAVFGVCMLAFVSSMLLPQQIVYFPSRTISNFSRVPRRPSLRIDFFRARYMVIASVLIVVSFTLPFARLLAWNDYVVLVSSTVLASVLGSLHGHLRASLHVVGLHGMAALVSISSLAVSSVSLALGHVIADVSDSRWFFAVPFLSLALGFLVGLPLWKFATKRIQPMVGRTEWDFRRRVLFIVPDLTVQVAWYLMGLMVVSVIGPAALASLEAARVVSAPVFVFAGGLMSYFVPTIIRSMGDRRVQVVRRLLGGATILMVVCSGIYAIVVSVGHSLVEWALQRQYGPELSAGRSLSNGLEGGSNLFSSVFLASAQPMHAILSVVLSSVIGLAITAPLLVVLGPMGMIVAQSMVSLCRLGFGVYVAGRGGIRPFLSA